jgi:hypothetical protein
MNLFLSAEKLNKIFIEPFNILNRAKVDLMIDDRPTSPIPSYSIQEDVNNIIDNLNIDFFKPDGICLREIGYVSSVLYWSLEPIAYNFFKEAESFILDIEPCSYIAVNEFYKIPKHGVYFEITYKEYYGLLISWDYIVDDDQNQIDILNFSWLSNCSDGYFFSIELPKKYKMLDLAELKKSDNFDLFEKAIGVLFYSLSQQENSIEDKCNGNKYNKLGEKIYLNIKKHNTENFGRVGHWRRGHLHLYWVNIKGIRTAVYKWLEPTWVSGSVVKKNP